MSQNPKTTAEFGEWIIWNGGECPVKNEVRGQVCLAGGSFASTEQNGRLLRLGEPQWLNQWQHDCDPHNRIMAYRLLIEPKVQESEVFWYEELGSFYSTPNVNTETRKAIITKKGDELSIRWAE